MWVLHMTRTKTSVSIGPKEMPAEDTLRDRFVPCVPQMRMRLRDLARGQKCFLLSFMALFLLILARCRHNPVGAAGGFPVKAGPILFISDSSGTSQLYSMNPDGGNVQQLTDDPDFPILNAKWSPDGRKIAVVSLVGDSLTYFMHRRAIFIMNADGSGRYQLTGQWFDTVDSTNEKVEYGGASGPVWSPNSKQIAYTRLMVPEAIANDDIFVINLDGANEKRITGSMNISETVTDWSADEKLFLADVIDWSKADSRNTVDIFSIDGKRQKQITPDMVTSGSALWSPDQEHIVYSSWGGERHELFLSDGEGSGARILPTTNRTFNYIAAWSSDSKKVLFNASGKIYVINEDGSNLRNITPPNLTHTLAVSWKRR